jgi:MOB kinase activator 1
MGQCLKACLSDDGHDDKQEGLLQEGYQMAEEGSFSSSVVQSNTQDSNSTDYLPPGQQKGDHDYKRRFNVKKHKEGTRQFDIHNRTMSTLGSGNLRQAVSLPQDVEPNEWLSVNTIDFYNELSLLCGLVGEAWNAQLKPGEGFPKGFEYRWADGKTIKKPIRCSSSEYVDYVMQWVEEQLTNASLFPAEGTGTTHEYPANFRSAMKKIVTRLFRVYGMPFISSTG